MLRTRARRARSCVELRPDALRVLRRRKAMRDDHGEVMKNAHLLGFFRRIVRLLCNRIRPVFVFDGATPALKRQTVALRRRRRMQADVKLKRVAEKLLLNQLRARQQQQARVACMPRAPSLLWATLHTTADMSSQQHTAQGQRGASAGASGVSPSHASATAAQQLEADALLAASLASGDDYDTATHFPVDWGDGVARADGDGEDAIDVDALDVAGGAAAALESDAEVDAVLAFELPELADGESLDVSALAALPMSMRLELMARMRDRQSAANREKFQNANDAAPSAFSTLQIETYLKTGRVKRQLNALVRDGVGGADAAPDALYAQRIAGDTVRASACSCALLQTTTEVPGCAQTQEFVFTDQYNPGGRETRSPGLAAHRSPRLQRQISAPPVKRQVFGALHPVLPPPLPGTLAHVHAASLPATAPASVAASPSAPFDSVASVEPPGAGDDAEAPADVIKVDFEVPLSGDEDEWEDVPEPSAAGVVADTTPDAGAAARPADAAAAPTPRSSTVVLHLDATSPTLELPDAATAPVDPAMPLTRSALYTRSHGFRLGRSLDEWEGAEHVPPTAESPEPLHLVQSAAAADEESDLQLAIQQSLADAVHHAAKKAPQVVTHISLLEEDNSAEQLSHAQEKVPATASQPRAELDDIGPVAIAAAAAGVSKRMPEPLAVEAGDDAERVSPSAQPAQPSSGPPSADCAAPQAARPDELQPPPRPMAPPPPPVMVVFQARTWTLSVAEFGAIAADLGRSWPEWLPSPLDLEEQPVVIRCAGKQWSVDTPMGESMQSIAHEAAAAAAGEARREPPAPPRRPPAALGKAVLRSPSAPAAAVPTLSAPGISNDHTAGGGVRAHVRAPPSLPEGGPAWSEKWEGISSVWQAPAAPAQGAQLHAQPQADNSGGSRAATEDEEAWLAAEEAEAAAEARAREAEQLEEQRMALIAEQRSAARAADVVTADMYTEVQELLTMFGVPYIIAPAEAEAQCAWLDAEGLVDGVITDDSDVFLFGAKTVYRNIFEAKKFVEVYLADNIKCAPRACVRRLCPSTYCL